MIFNEFLYFGTRFLWDTLYCYSDSQISLAWIKGLGKEFKTFVQNRVLEIRSKVNANRWGYCKTADNPADLLTRVNPSNPFSDLSLVPIVRYKDFQSAKKSCDLYNAQCEHKELTLGIFLNLYYHDF